MRLGGNGQWSWNVPMKGDMGIEVTFRPMGDGAFGLVVCGDGDRSGYLAVADFPLPGLPANDLIFRLPAQGAGLLSAILTQGAPAIQQIKNQPNLAALAREGQRVRYTLGGVRMDTAHPQYTDGRVAIALLNHQVLIERIRVFGEPDPAWLDAELKKAEGK